ncbi:hypothetical protein ACOMHN_065796 [Nucella lapillus]
MDHRMKEALRKSRIFLIENVIFDVLVDHLVDQDIFSDTMLDYIKAGSDRIEKIRRLLEYLVRRPDTCYMKFLTALTNSGHEHCARRIEENYVQSGPTQVSDPTACAPVLPRPTCATGISDEDVPMPQVYQGYPGGNVPVRMGFPEVSGSMHAFAGSFTSAPVQESSMPGEGEVTPSSASLSSPGEGSSGEMIGVDRMPAGDSMQHSEVSNGQVVMSVYQRHIYSNPAAVYKMDSSPRGLALVINNEHFSSMLPRTGSQRDMENLHVLFKSLGFHVCHEKDKTADEIRALVRSFAEYAPLQEADALVVVILSHGGRNGIIFGKDGAHGKGPAQDYITDEEIRDRFSARNCPLMAHKPKLIIIQACRGANEDVADGVRPFYANNNISNNANQAGSRLGNDGSDIDSNASTASTSRIANMADICLIHSTVQGYVSYRHPINGSPFIQEMTRLFQEKADREHLTDMMTEVNRKLACRQLQEDVRTVPSTTNTLTKKWFLNPPSN